VREQLQPMGEAPAAVAADDASALSQAATVPGNTDEAGTQSDMPREGGRRERRPRNRGGRDRADRPSEEGASRELFATPEAAAEQPRAEVTEAAVMAPTADTRQEPEPEAVAVAFAAPAPAAQQPAPAPVVETPAAQALPPAETFVLPLDTLADVAQQAGLVWVNSDAEKIAAVQAAIAATPAPAHVPRERPAVVVVDAGPLVLVETRRHLGQDA
jgi:ribonuclease E